VRLPTASTRTVVPSTIEDACEAMRETRDRGEAVAFVGGGTQLDLGYPPERVDIVLRTEQLSRVLEYAPADMTVTVEAGITLARLQGELEPHRQRLALDSPNAQTATIGGLIATNAFGARRARYGSLRDLIVGIGVVRADGALVRGGGKVVKNVAGFDVPKLMVGSLGTLGLIATATFRLHPLPEAQRWLVVNGCGAEDVRGFARAIVEAQLEPAAVVAVGEGGAYATHVLFEGFGAGVEEQAALFAARAQQTGHEARAHDADDEEAYERLHGAARASGDVRVKMTFLPAQISAVARDALAPVAAALAGDACAIYPTIGVAFCSGACGDADVVAAALGAARAVVEDVGGSLTVEAAPEAVRERVDIFGAPPPSFRIMRNLKERFDPERRCNRGRFVGRL
jgi:glycolate oxidase FAD binding subunit